MKKEYIKPFLEMVDLADEDYCESIGVGSPNECSLQSDGWDAKERNYVDFSDEESIW